MHSDVAISVKNLTKTYRIFGGAGDRIKHALTFGRKRFYHQFTALRDVSFEIRKGEAVGIIGRNGSGKSTLLQLVCGILKPTSGSVDVKGRISALLELGSGFNPEFTGRENVYFQGAVMGFTKAEMDARFGDIVAFADIGDSLDQPVRTYSTGMYVRLAFSVQIMSAPDILIIDEALSVGDFFFQQKCFSRIRELCQKGLTLLFVSHDTNTVRDLCNRAIYLKKSKLEFSGETLLAIRRYLAETNAGFVPGVFLSGEGEKSTLGEVGLILQESVWSAPRNLPENNPGHLVAVAFYDENHAPVTSFRLGSTMHTKIVYWPLLDLPMHVIVEFRNKFDKIVTSLGSLRLGLVPPECRDDQILIFSMELDLSLEAGNYSVVVNLGCAAAPNRALNTDSSPLLGPISVHWDYEHETAPFLGMVGLPSKGKFEIVDVEPSKNQW